MLQKQPIAVMLFLGYLYMFKGLTNSGGWMILLLPGIMFDKKSACLVCDCVVTIHYKQYPKNLWYPLRKSYVLNLPWANIEIKKFKKEVGITIKSKETSS